MPKKQQNNVMTFRLRKRASCREKVYASRIDTENRSINPEIEERDRAARQKEDDKFYNRLDNILSDAIQRSKKEERIKRRRKRAPTKRR